jgi:hypothetical protein
MHPHMTGGDLDVAEADVEHGGDEGVPKPRRPRTAIRYDRARKKPLPPPQLKILAAVMASGTPTPGLPPRRPGWVPAVGG